ncbi:hypothetical protein [Georgenia yuyongxinii]
MSQAQPFQPNLHPEDDADQVGADLGEGAPGAIPGLSSEHQTSLEADLERARKAQEEDPAAADQA